MLKEIKFANNIITSLIDYPDHVCSVIFTIDCNLRCPFCYNKALFKENNPPELTRQYVLQELMKRKKYTPYIVISGGEPTIHHGLLDFIKDLRKRGFGIKLDTNGLYPRYLMEILPYLDHISMDLKTHPKKYIQFLPKFSAMAPKSIEPSLLESVNLIKNNPFLVSYEFRTTLVPDLVTEEDIKYWMDIVGKITLKPYKKW